MNIKTTPAKKSFIEERDFRYNFLLAKKLFPYLCTKVRINDKPITSRTAKDAFKVERFEDLTKSGLAVWLESEKIINKIIEETETYATESDC